MANDNDFFNDVDGMEGLDDGPEAVSEPSRIAHSSVEAVYEDLYEGPQASQDDMAEVDAQMQAVEQRLEVAQFYKLLLGHGLFGKDYQNNKAAQKVLREVQAFARQRLGVLMGLAPEKRDLPKTESQFTDTQVAALKAVADRVIGSQQPARPLPPPSLAPVEKAPAAPQPSIQPIQAKQQPQVRAPVPAKPPKPAAPAKVQQKPAQPASGQKSPLAVMQARVPEKYREDPTLRVENGRVLVQQRTEEGTPLYVHDRIKGTKSPLMKDVTMPAKPAPGSIQPVPTPSIQQFEMVMQQQADSMLTLADRRASSLGIKSQMGVVAQYGFARETDSGE